MRDITMDVGDLRVFEAVARLGAMSRAAAELHTVQSNITARVRALEEHLGCRLFERRPAGVVLTAAGERLLPYARALQQMLADAARAARDDGKPSGRLVLGTLETTAALRLSPLLAAYAKAFPEVDLTLRTGTTCELIAAVREGRVEGAFVCGPVADPVLESRPAFEEELSLLAAPGLRSLDALAARGGARIVVLRAGCSYRQRLEALLARRGIPAPRVMEFGTLDAIIASVAAGLGVTLLPVALAQRLGTAGGLAVLRLPPSEAIVETIFLRRRGAFVSSALRAFLDRAEAAFPRKAAA